MMLFLWLAPLTLMVTTVVGSRGTMDFDLGTVTRMFSRNQFKTYMFRKELGPSLRAMPDPARRPEAKFYGPRNQFKFQNWRPKKFRHFLVLRFKLQVSCWRLQFHRPV